MTTTKKLEIAAVFLWTLGLTSLRAVRLPNDFSKAHWLIDYRFGFVKRGLIGTVVSLATSVLRSRPTEQLIAVLSSVQFVIFCVVLMGVGLRIAHRSGWSSSAILAVLVFFSSPFIVMSAHLIGYFDNIIIVLAVISIALLLGGRIWLAASLQAISILVHENALLVGFPVFCLAWLLVNSRHVQSNRARLPVWPLLLPAGTFLVLILSQSFSPPDLERSLNAHLSSFPFIERNLRNTRVPHWITITLVDSYSLHQGFFAGRLISGAMLGLVLPSMLAILALIFDAYRVRDLSAESIVLLGVCVVPQTMHLVAWDTTRIWTYSILVSFLALWVYAELFGARKDVSQFVRLLCLAALALNSVELTPLMDGLRDRFDLTIRLIFYAPVMAAAVDLILFEDQVPVRERLSIQRSI
jgi:hypothetical protein